MNSEQLPESEEEALLQEGDVIIVTVELLSARTGLRTHMGTGFIANDGTGSVSVGNYKVELSKWGKPKNVWKKVQAKGFPRQRLGPWDLLCYALQAVVGQRVLSIGSTTSSNKEPVID